MAHRLWGVQDVILHMVYFLPAKDAVHLLQTCSKLYSIHEQRAFWYTLTGSVLSPRLQSSSPYKGLLRHTLPDLKSLVHRAAQADEAWSTSTAPLVSFEEHALDPGDYVDAVLPGTDLLLVYNHREETLSLFNCKSGRHYDEYFQLGKKMTNRSEVVCRDGYFRVAYVVRKPDEEDVQWATHVIDIRFFPEISNFRILKAFTIETSAAPITVFVHERGVGHIYCEGVLTYNESSKKFTWCGLDLQKHFLRASRIVNDRVCLVIDQVDVEKRTSKNTMCYLSPSMSSLDHVRNRPQAVHEKVSTILEIVPITIWDEPESRFEERLMEGTHSAMDGQVGMTFDVVQVDHRDDLFFVRITASTFEVPCDCSSDGPAYAQPRASAETIELPGTQLLFSDDTTQTAYRSFEARVAGDGAMLVFPVVSSADELRRVLEEHARTAPTDREARDLAEAMRLDPEICDDREYRSESNWGKLKLVRFVPHGPADVCDLETPYDLAGDCYADAILLDAAQGKVYVQESIPEDSPRDASPSLWCLNYA